VRTIGQLVISGAPATKAECTRNGIQWNAPSLLPAEDDGQCTEQLGSVMTEANIRYINNMMPLMNNVMNRLRAGVILDSALIRR